MLKGVCMVLGLALVLLANGCNSCYYCGAATACANVPGQTITSACATNCGTCPTITLTVGVAKPCLDKNGKQPCSNCGPLNCPVCETRNYSGSNNCILNDEGVCQGSCIYTL